LKEYGSATEQEKINAEHENLKEHSPEIKLK